MRYLLDTDVFLWCLTKKEQLSKQAMAIIDEPKNAIFVSSASTWELSTKKASGKLDSPDNLEEEIEACNFIHLPITIPHTIFTGTLPRYHNDPFDRILIAQALVEGLKLITRDREILNYQVPIIKA